MNEAICSVLEHKGQFYIVPLSAQLNGVSFATREEAEYIAKAVNGAYERGWETARLEIRKAIGLD